MSDFKVGQRVRCINGTTGKLKKGEIYEITRVYNNGRDEFLHINGEDAPGMGWFASRFDKGEDDE